MDGYIDLTMEEMVALARAIELRIPAPVLTTGPPPSDEVLATAAKVGRRVLVARGLAKSVEGGAEIDAGVLDAIEGLCTGAVVTAIGHVGTSWAQTWLVAGQEDTVVASILSSGNYRLRVVPTELLPSVIVKLSSLDREGAGEAAPGIEVAFDLESLGEKLEDVVGDDGTPPDLDVAELLVAVGESESGADAIRSVVDDTDATSRWVITFWPEGDGEIHRGSVIWLERGDGSLMAVDVEDDRAVLAPVDGRTLLDRIRTGFPVADG